MTEGDKMSLLKNREMDLTTGSIFKKLIIFSIPLLLTLVLQLLFNATDIAILGIFVDDKAVAAVGGTGSLVNLIIGLFVGFSVGSNVVIAKCVGLNNKEKAERAVQTSFLLSLISGVIIAIIGFFFSKTFLGWMKCDPLVIDQAAIYLRIYFIGMPIIMLYNFNSSILRAVGDTLRPLLFLLLGGVLNVGFNIFFILVLKKDVEGVAVATVISNLVSSILSTIVLVKNNGFSHLKFKNIKIHAKELKEILIVGIPSGLQTCVFSISNVLIQSSVNVVGADAMAGNSISDQFTNLTYNVMVAISLSTLSFVSQNLGAGKIDRIKKIIFTSLISVTIIGIVVGLLLFSVKGFIYPIFSQEEDVLSVAYTKTTIFCLTYFTCGIMDCLCQTTRGLGKSVFAMIISLIGSCLFRIIWIFFIYPNYDGLAYLYISYPISWILTSIIYVIVLIPLYKKIKKMFTKN